MAKTPSGFETFLKFPNFLRSQETTEESGKTTLILLNIYTSERLAFCFIVEYLVTWTPDSGSMTQNPGPY